ncbi:MAG: hypothetical protein NT080_13255 [Spirochaetes bacterium]|nr:hypothetical protein [Spirochaetota bacterium]
MSIKPIDLQTLFMNLNQLGKEQAAGREGAAIQQAVHGAVEMKKQAEASKAIRKPDPPKDGAERIHDRDARKGETPAEGEKGKKRGNAADAPDDAAGEGPEIVTDPELGGHIDVSG